MAVFPMVKGVPSVANPTYTADLSGSMSGNTLTASDNYDVLTIVVSGYNASATISNITLTLNSTSVAYSYAREKGDNNARAQLVWVLKDIKTGDVVALSGSLGNVIIYGENY